ncbi:MAG TPA: response regulator [Candidatus Dormibacteraeota bacterium]|nr:response regulator [Candidatus Dormibacteraeota bacterium]
MNTPLTSLPLSLPLPGPEKKKRVLLVDTSSRKRDLRAEVMRKLGINVDCAADIGEARSWWRADLYDLVLINMEKGPGHRDRFCDDVRGATPPQRLAFLVGGPEYLAGSPNLDEPLPPNDGDDHVLLGEVKAALSAHLTDLNQRWGILEASRRISAVRSACSARSRAMQDRPAIPRDLEGRAAKSIAVPTTLDDLLRKEMQ